MNKTRIFILLALFVCASLWFAPVAWASQCAVMPPSKHIPVFRLVQPTALKEFNIQEKDGKLEINNTSTAAIYILPRQTRSKIHSLKISVKDTALISIDNAAMYLDGAPGFHGSRCNDDGGVPDGQSIPTNKSTMLIVQVRGEVIRVPIEIAYIENPNYALQLRKYEEYKNQFYNFSGVLRMLLACGYMLLFFFLMIIVILIVRFLRKRARAS